MRSVYIPRSVLERVLKRSSISQLPTTERALAYLSRVTAVQHLLPSLVDSHRTVYISCAPMFAIFPAVLFPIMCVFRTRTLLPKRQGSGHGRAVRPLSSRFGRDPYSDVSKYTTNNCAIKKGKDAWYGWSTYLQGTVSTPNIYAVRFRASDSYFSNSKTNDPAYAVQKCDRRFFYVRI